MNLCRQNLLDEGEGSKKGHVARGAGARVGDEDLRAINEVDDLNSASIVVEVGSDLSVDNEANESEPLIVG